MTTDLTHDRPHLDRLADILANTYALAVKTHAAHWNVTGPSFYAAHLLFEKQYQELFEAADTLAERVRALGIATPVDIASIGGLSTLPRGADQADVTTLAAALCADNHALSKACRACVALSEQVGDVGTSDLLIARVKSHDMAAWMLGATAGETAAPAATAPRAMAGASAASTPTR